MQVSLDSSVAREKNWLPELETRVLSVSKLSRSDLMLDVNASTFTGQLGSGRA